MSTGDWSDSENDLIVADYFAMLAEDLAGRPYNKAEHNRRLQDLIGRSKGSIEFKHQNVSAVLLGLGEACITGYKPAFNFQTSLVDRKQPAAIIHDPDIASRRMVEMLQQGEIITERGKTIPTRIDTICVHGDTSAPVALAARIRDALLTHAIEPKRFRCVLPTVE